MPESAGTDFVALAKGLAPQIAASAEEIEASRHLPLALVEAIAEAGLFRLWIPRSLGGEETDPMTLAGVVEEIARADGAAGWCVAIGGEYGAFGGYRPPDAAREIYGTDPRVRTAGAFRPVGNANIVDGGYRVTGRLPLGSGCQHSAWIVGGCRVLDGDQPRLSSEGAPVWRILFFPAADAKYSILGTASVCVALAVMITPSRTFLSGRTLAIVSRAASRTRASVRDADERALCHRARGGSARHRPSRH